MTFLTRISLLPVLLASEAIALGVLYYRISSGWLDWNTGFVFMAAVWIAVFLVAESLLRVSRRSAQVRTHTFWLLAMLLASWSLYQLRWRLDSPLQVLYLTSIAALLVSALHALEDFVRFAKRSAALVSEMADEGSRTLRSAGSRAWRMVAPVVTDAWVRAYGQLRSAKPVVVRVARIALYSCPILLVSVTYQRIADEALDLTTGLLFLTAVGAATLVATNGLSRLTDASQGTRTNLRLMWTIAFMLIIGLELFLRFGLGRHTTWEESNVGGPYRSLRGHAAPGSIAGRARNQERKAVLTEYTYYRRTNSLGLSEAEVPVAADRREYRIVALGDSFTEGMGVSYDATWVKVMEHELAARTPDRTITTINAGLGASDVFFEYRLLKDHLLALSPRLVILAFNSGDVVDTGIRGGMERFRPDGSMRPIRTPPWEWLYGISYLTRFVVRDVLDYNAYFVGPRDLPVLEREAVRKIRSAVAAFAELSERHGFELLVVVHPFTWDVQSGTYPAPFRQILPSLQEAHGAYFLDLLPRFQEEMARTGGNMSELYWPIDGHHTQKGYAIMGRAIAERIVELKVIDRPRPRESPVADASRSLR